MRWYSRLVLVLATVLLSAATTMAASSLCQVTGAVLSVTGAPCANCQVTFDSEATQWPDGPEGPSVARQVVTARTDQNGNLSNVFLTQLLIVKVSVNNALPQTVIVPNAGSVDFQQLATQLQPFSSSQHLTDLLPPVGNINMNGFNFSAMSCPTDGFQGEVEGCPIGGAVPAPITATNLQVNSGVFNNGNGFKHARLTTGSIPLNSIGTVTLNWITAFRDVSYTVICGIEDASGFLTILNYAKSTAPGVGITAQVQNTDPSNAHTGTLDCVGIHD